MESRVIHLRRPPTLIQQDDVFVPPQATGPVLDQVQQRWEALCAANPAFFDGRLLHVLGVHRNGHGGASLHVADCAYRFYAVQNETFDLGVRPLGVKGVVIGERGVLMGLRSDSVAAYPRCWEFAPGGVIEPNEPPEAVIERELREETALRMGRPPVALAVVYDPVVRSWELVYEVSVRPGRFVANPAEYDELRWCGRGALPAPRSEVTEQILGVLGPRRTG